MDGQGLLSPYVAPAGIHYGNLVDITASAHLLVGAADVSDLSFSAPNKPGGGGGDGGGGPGGGGTGGGAGGGGPGGGGPSGGGPGGGVGLGGIPASNGGGGIAGGPNDMGGSGDA